MFEAVGKYENGKLLVDLRSKNVVEVRLENTTGLEDGKTYKVEGEFSTDFVNGTAIHKIAVTKVDETSSPSAFTRYKGVVRVCEVKEKQGIIYYRVETYSDQLENVDLVRRNQGWVGMGVHSELSTYPYRTGDLVYVDARVRHNYRRQDDRHTDGDGYELHLKTDRCYKIDQTEYNERIRLAKAAARKDRD